METLLAILIISNLICFGKVMLFGPDEIVLYRKWIKRYRIKED
jgi:hypothetical protein